MLSRRAVWDTPTNELTRAREALLATGTPLVDLTVSNPTSAGFDYPLDEIGEALARGAHAPYDPHPLGLRSAREAVALTAAVNYCDVVITASTSEAYSFLFKLLTDPGDRMLTATPSYPLLEHLASLEQVSLASFPVTLHRRWELERHAVASAITPSTRALIAVNPNNPTGSYVTRSEQDTLASFGLPLISDEVFFEYELHPPADIARLVREDVLSFALGGLSKSAGLPHLKLGWIIVSGPPEDRRRAIAALELIADNFLSVATPVQHALPDLLRLAPRIRQQIMSRTKRNLANLQGAVAAHDSLRLLPVEGGWMAVLRVPRIAGDEEIALRLLREASVIVQPGYFFDFAMDGYLAISLLTPEAAFDEGISRILPLLSA